MIKVAVVGAGGVNSWSVHWLDELNKDFLKDDVIYVKIFDGDNVEAKNIMNNNQNFKVDDLIENKADSLAKRYAFDSEPIFIDDSNLEKLKDFDYIILGVDSHKIRRMIYNYALSNEICLLDLRAQGRIMSYELVDGSKDMNYYDTKYFSNSEIMERKGSCQLESDRENNTLRCTNKVISLLGIECLLLCKLRREDLSTNDWKFVY